MAMSVWWQVVMLKSKWGLVRAVGRPLDVFFNYASLVPPLTKEDLAKGTEVQFTLSRNAESHKLEAVGCACPPLIHDLPIKLQIGHISADGYLFDRDSHAGGC